MAEPHTEPVPSQSAGKLHKHFKLIVRKRASVDYVQLNSGYWLHIVQCVRRLKSQVTDTTGTAKS